MNLPAKMPDGAFTIAIDSREQLPFDFGDQPTVVTTLATGDYSVRGLEDTVALERKSLPDLVACCGRERERFAREVQRLLAYPTRAVIVEASWHDIEAGEWRSRLTPKQVGASVTSWMTRGVPFVLAGDRRLAKAICLSMLRTTARHRWEQLRTFSKGLNA